MTPARQQLTEFCRAFYSGAPEGAWTTLQLLPNQTPMWLPVDDPEVLADQAATAMARPDVNGVYYAMGSADRQVAAASQRRAPRMSAADVTHLSGVWAEFDVKDGFARDEAHIDEALTKFGLAPSVTYRSGGGGVHALWLFPEWWDLHDEGERIAAALLVRDVQVTLRAHLGGKIDSTFDLARMLRLPGTTNAKYDPPRLVTLVTDTGVRYEPDLIAEHVLDQELLAKHDSTRNAGGDLGAHHDAEVRALSLSAVWSSAQTLARTDRHVIPGYLAKVLDLVGHSGQLAQTWARRRPDLADDQSAYDAALVRGLRAAGVSLRDTVEAVMIHRLVHNQKPEKVDPGQRSDYLLRTIDFVAAQINAAGPTAAEDDVARAINDQARALNAQPEPQPMVDEPVTADAVADSGDHRPATPSPLALVAEAATEAPMRTHIDAHLVTVTPAQRAEREKRQQLSTQEGRDEVKERIRQRLRSGGALPAVQQPPAPGAPEQPDPEPESEPQPEPESQGGWDHGPKMVDPAWGEEDPDVELTLPYYPPAIINRARYTQQMTLLSTVMGLPSGWLLCGVEQLDQGPRAAIVLVLAPGASTTATPGNIARPEFRVTNVLRTAPAPYDTVMRTPIQMGAVIRRDLSMTCVPKVAKWSSEVEAILVDVKTADTRGLSLQAVALDALVRWFTDNAPRRVLSLAAEMQCALIDDSGTSPRLWFRADDFQRSTHATELRLLPSAVTVIFSAAGVIRQPIDAGIVRGDRVTAEAAEEQAWLCVPEETLTGAQWRTVRDKARRAHEEIEQRDDERTRRHLHPVS